MTLKHSWVSRAARALKLSVAGIALLATAGGLTAGCLDRPVAPATPRTSNVVVKTVTQSGVDKIDLLFMIDNSISMADKQRILAEAVPVLVERLIDPICVDDDGNPTGGTSSDGCGNNQAEFSPIRNIHIGVITSSLGNHGGDVCVTDPAEMPPRTLNDKAQLMPSVRTGLYSYQNYGFLAWDPRAGQEIPVPDPHPGKGMNETNPMQFVTDFTAHVTSTGERGCGYEASLEAWYRFLIDPEPISDVTVDGNNQFSVRGPVNPVVLEQRGRFLRPDSLLAIIMLTDENDCSINDENGQQGWLVGRRTAMPRGSDACARPDDPNIYRCCIPCVLLDAGIMPDGCSYGGDAACNTAPQMDGSGGHYLTPIEDSTNLRCYQQVRRFGVNLLYPWWRYRDALTQPRIRLRPPNDGMEVTNPIYTPGTDGTPAREQGLVFLAGIIGVPWQDIATPETLTGRALRYIPAPQMPAPVDAMGLPSGPNRWDVILGDPDTGRQPTDPFMIETIGTPPPAGIPPNFDGTPRSGANPIVPGESISAPGGARNNINGTEQNIINRDDLQYACIFDLVPDVACTMANQDGCDCNAGIEQMYNRPLCQYQGAADGTQTHAKAYPGTRHLQVLKGFGANSIVASICPKNVMANGSAAQDPDYGYNPAVGAIIERLKEALIATCLPRPLVAENNEVPCTVVEAFQPPMGTACSCTDPGRRALEGDTAKVRGAVEDELKALSLCGGNSGVSCASYCMCEIIQFSGAELDTCQNSETDPMNIYGYCYVDPYADPPQGNPALVADCPDTQRQIIRFLGPDVPKPRALGFIACLGASVSAGTSSSSAGSGGM
jgi:hypothetical protein